MPPTKKPFEKLPHLTLASRSSNGGIPAQRNEPYDHEDAERHARELSEYDDRDEVTANIHVSLDSIHDTDPPAKKVRAGLVAVGSGIGIAILTGVAALLQNCGHR